MKELLPLLLILVCPLMMVFMMRGMHGGGHRGSGHAHSPRALEGDDMTAAELRRLRDEIDRRIEALDDRVRTVEAAGDRVRAVEAARSHRDDGVGA